MLGSIVIQEFIDHLASLLVRKPRQKLGEHIWISRLLPSSLPTDENQTDVLSQIASEQNIQMEMLQWVLFAGDSELNSAI